MTRLLAYRIAAAVVVAAPSAASATTLLDLTNLPDQDKAVTSLQFTAGAGSTTLSIGGYNLPDFTRLSDIELTLTGDSTNLLGQTFSLAAAVPACSNANQGPVGAFGTDNVTLASICVGVNDTFSQTIGTSVGASYTLSFLLTTSDVPSGLLITASDATVGGGGGVPEPATWAMMLLGFGAIGVSLRLGRKKRALARTAA
jgi:hypothetical protein